MLVIELVSKWEICWALWSLVVFDPNDDQTRNNVGELYCRTLYFFPDISQIPATPWT